MSLFFLPEVFFIFCKTNQKSLFCLSSENVVFEGPIKNHYFQWFFHSKINGPIGSLYFTWLKIFDLILRFYFGMDLIILTQITKKNKSCVDFYFVAKKTNQVLFLPWKSKSSVILLVWMKSNIETILLVICSVMNFTLSLL